MDPQRPYLERYRLLLQDPKLRKDHNRPFQGDLPSTLSKAMNPKKSIESPYIVGTSLPQNFPKLEGLQREMDQAVNRIEEFYRKSRAIEDLTISLRGKINKNTNMLSNDEKKLESLMIELNDKFKGVDRIFDNFEEVKRRVSDAHGMSNQRDSSKEDLNRSISKLFTQGDKGNRVEIQQEDSVVNKLKKELEEEKRKSAILVRENELLMLDNKKMSGGQSPTKEKDKDKGEDYAGIKKQFEVVLARIGDLEKVNMRLQDRDKEIMRENNKLEDRVRVAENEKRVLEEKEVILIKENGRLKERIEATEAENRRIKEELIRVKKESMEIRKTNDSFRSEQSFRPIMGTEQMIAYEERKRLMEENERLIQIVSELRREKANQSKIEEENEEIMRPRLITFGVSANEHALEEKEVKKGKEVKQDPNRRSLRVQRLSQMSAAPSSQPESAQNMNEKAAYNSTLLRLYSDVSNQEDMNISRGGKQYVGAMGNGEGIKHSRNQSMGDMMNTSLHRSTEKVEGRISLQEAKPYIDIKELVARGKAEGVSDAMNITTFELKERR